MAYTFGFTILRCAQCRFQEAETQLHGKLAATSRSIVLGRFYDSSPMFLRFGKLQAQLLPQARYLERTEEAGYVKLKTVSFDEYRRLHPRWTPQMGVLEVRGS